MILISSFIFLVVFAESTYSITLSIELFTLGSGYITEPITLEVDKNSNVAEIVINALHNNGYLGFYGGTTEDSFYLAYISSGDKKNKTYEGYNNSNNGQPLANSKTLDISESIPECIKSHLDTDFYTYDYLNNGFIGEFDFTTGSGWMYSVNNVFPNNAMSEYYVQDGDVIRLQFTLALGRDIGGSNITNLESPYYTTANKDNLTKLAADINSRNLKNNTSISALYKDALNVLQEVDASQTDVDNVYNKLNNTLKSLDNSSKEDTSVSNTVSMVSNFESKTISSVLSENSENIISSSTNSIINSSELSVSSSNSSSNTYENQPADDISHTEQSSQIENSVINSNIESSKSDMLSDSYSHNDNISNNNDNGSKNTAYIIFISIGILLVAAIVGFIIYYIIKGRKK